MNENQFDYCFRVDGNEQLVGFTFTSNDLPIGSRPASRNNKPTRPSHTTTLMDTNAN